MILVIHTLNQVEVGAALLKASGELLQMKRKKVTSRHTEIVTPAIDQLLKKNKVNLSNLSGILVATGPGGFSAVRSGVVVANALGFALQVPVMGVEGQFNTIQDMLVSDRFSRALAKLKHTRRPTQARPAYGAQPNISQAKQKKVQQHQLRA